MPRTHGANKSILFAQILEPYVVNLSGFAQIKHVFLLMCTRPYNRNLESEQFLRMTKSTHNL